MSPKKCFTLLLLLFIVHSSSSQNSFDNYQFRLVAQEASKSGIYAITQDQFGFMWVGTNGAGLYKYDGVNNVTYEQNAKSNSINSNLIYATYVDKRNRLWLGTDEGLCLYNRDHDGFETIDIQQNFSKGTVISVKSIVEDNTGNLYLGTLNNGLLKLNVKSRKISKIKLATAENYLVNCLVKAKDGSIFLGTSFGLKVVDRSEERRVGKECPV